MSLSRRSAFQLAGAGLGAALLGGASAAPAEALPNLPRYALDHAVLPIVKRYNIGISLMDRRTGAVWGYRQDTRYNLASCTKVITAITVCLKAQDARRSLTSRERDLITLALRKSDNEAQTALWAQTGRWSAYDATAKRMGLSANTRATYGRGWGRSRSSPRDLRILTNKLLAHQGPLTSSHFSFITAQMDHATVYWGIAPMGRTSSRKVMNKNGWYHNPDDGTWWLNSFGRVVDSKHNYSLALLSSGWKSDVTGKKQLNNIGQQVYAALGLGPLR